MSTINTIKINSINAINAINASNISALPVLRQAGLTILSLNVMSGPAIFFSFFHDSLKKCLL
jgi:hypothetical protein